MSKKTLVLLCAVCFIFSTLFFWHRMGQTAIPEVRSSSQDLGRLCVAQVYPAISKGVEKEENGSDKKAADKTAKEDSQSAKENKKETSEKKQAEKRPEKKVDNSKPQVIIYHTHSTESYQPYSESNFHRVKEKGTVRDVGDVMTKELNRLGIAVVHDKTIHDRPSYNESYDRSLETITSLMKKYPTARYIIDLHRDAAAYAGNVGKTVQIEGETTATFSLVVGQNNANYNKLMAHAKKVSNKAEAMYSGFGGRIIEKEYRYNEYIADKCLLLEIGNNQNKIEEVENTGKYFARVLAEVIEEEK